MKSLISILLLFCSFVSYSQTSISDTLVIYTGFGSEEVILNKDFTFKYRDNSCTYHNEGVGLYAIENDKLVLLFETPKVIIKDTIKPSTYFIKDVNYDSAQKVNLEFCITDSYNMPLSKATINLKNLERGAFTKDDGSAKIRNIEKNQIIQLKVSYIVMNL